jgi:DNA-binding SARP family transcriptional activator
MTHERHGGMLRVHLLGQPHLTYDGVPFAFSGRPKVLPLLAFLLLDTTAPLGRSRIAASLWPDDTDAVARANLRRHLHYLHDLLPPGRDAPWLAIEPGTVRWNPDANFWVDVVEFRASVDDADRREEAVRLYTGDLLEPFDEAWMVEPRRELSVRYTSCLLELIGAHRARRDYPRAREYARVLLAYDPWREDALRQLLLILYESGARSAAIREYRRFAREVMEELGVEPMPETVAVYRSLERGIAPPGSMQFVARPPPVHASAEPPFVGRAAEMERLVECLRQAAGGAGRVVSVSGPAGIGKSRMIREGAVAAEARGALVAFGTVDGRETES